VLHEKTMLNQIDLFREHGLGNFRDFLLHLAKDPAMIFWLDNNFNHKTPLMSTGAGSSWSCSPWAWAWTAKRITLKTT